MKADDPIHSRADEVACIDVVEIITDYLEGALPEDQARRLERHLDTCPGCTEYVEQLRMVAGSLTGFTEDSLPAEVRAALIADFHRCHDH